METDGQQQSHHVKRVVLPSGKTIEVVYFDRTGETGPQAEPAPVSDLLPATDARTAPERAPGEPRELHICVDCDSDLVYPVEWEESDGDHWKIALRCPNCEWTETGTFHQDVVDLFDEVLDQGTEALTKDLRRLMRANMADEIDLFVQALAADAILPEDF